MYTPNSIPTSVLFTILPSVQYLGYFALEPMADKKYATTQDKKTSDYLEN